MSILRNYQSYHLFLIHNCGELKQSLKAYQIYVTLKDRWWSKKDHFFSKIWEKFSVYKTSIKSRWEDNFAYFLRRLAWVMCSMFLIVVIFKWMCACMHICEHLCGSQRTSLVSSSGLPSTSFETGLSLTRSL